MVWYSHLFQNFPQFIVIHTIKCFGIVNKAEIDVFLELSCFFHDPADVGTYFPANDHIVVYSQNMYSVIPNEMGVRIKRILDIQITKTYPRYGDELFMG